MRNLFLSLLAVALMLAMGGCDPTAVSTSNTNESSASSSIRIRYLNGTGVIRLTWDKIYYATDYDVYKQMPSNDDKDREYRLIATTPNLFLFDALSETNPMVAGDSYNYLVVARGEKIKDTKEENQRTGSIALASDASLPLFGAAITAPTNLVVNQVSDFDKTTGKPLTQLYISWTGTVDAESYRVFLKKGNQIYVTTFAKDLSFGTNQGDTNVRSLTLTKKLTTPGAGIWTITVAPTAYSSWFSVPATSTISKDFTEAARVAKVTGLTATTNLLGRIEIKFKKITTDTVGQPLSADATYEIWKCLSGSENYVKTTLSASAMTDGNDPATDLMFATDVVGTDTKEGESYDYIVVAVNGTDRSEPSSVATGKVIKAPTVYYEVSAPTMVGLYDPSAAYPFVSKIDIEFSKVVALSTVTKEYVAATGYDIFRSDDGGTTFKMIAENVSGTQSVNNVNNWFYSDSVGLVKTVTYIYKVRARADAVSGKYPLLISGFSGNSLGLNIAP